MGTFLLTAVIVVLTLGSIAYIADKRDGGSRRDTPPVFSLLPGDVAYESPSGNFKFYFPITTSIVVSVVLSLVMWLFS